jgi:hypothetical protein
LAFKEESEEAEGSVGIRSANTLPFAQPTLDHSGRPAEGDAKCRWGVVLHKSVTGIGRELVVKATASKKSAWSTWPLGKHLSPPGSRYSNLPLQHPINVLPRFFCRIWLPPPSAPEQASKRTSRASLRVCAHLCFHVLLLLCFLTYYHYQHHAPPQRAPE